MIDDISTGDADAEEDVDHGTTKAGGETHHGGKHLLHEGVSDVIECMRGQHTATLVLATRSASELPTAKIVRPMMASESPKMNPNV